MNYDFDTIIDRRGTNSLKYDFVGDFGKPEDVLPMWVADMDFTAPPEVLEDIQKAVAHGILGYTVPKSEYYNAVTQWFGSRFGFYATQDQTIKASGLVFALVRAICAFTAPNDTVLIQTPVYHPFYSIVSDNNRTLVTNPFDQFCVSKARIFAPNFLINFLTSKFYSNE